jgi:hypothetical protein
MNNSNNTLVGFTLAEPSVVVGVAWVVIISAITIELHSVLSIATSA